MSDTDVAFVDLIEEQPLDRHSWSLAATKCITRLDDSECTICDRQYADYLGNFQPWRIVIAAHNGEPLFRSTERYFNEEDARRAIEIAFGPNSNVWLRQEGKEPVAVRVAWR